MIIRIRTMAFSLMGLAISFAGAAEPKVQVVKNALDQTTAIRVNEINDEYWASLTSPQTKRESLDTVVQVFVANDKSESRNRQGIFGEVQLDDKSHSITFTPRYPFGDGMAYAAEFSLPGSKKILSRLDFHIPAKTKEFHKKRFSKVG